MSFLTFKIATPERLVFEETELDSVTLPTHQGEITVLPKHIPLVSKVVPGEVVVRKKGSEQSLMTMQGFLHLDNKGNIIVLSDYAIRSEEVELAKVEEARKKAQEAMKEKLSERDFVVAEAELRKTLLELRVAQKRREIRIKI